MVLLHALMCMCPLTMQVASCCRSLGLTSSPGPQEFLQLAWLARCVLALVCCLPLVPGEGAAQPAAPSPQHVALVEGLLQSQVLVELSWALQRLMPQHTSKDQGGACSCCRLDAPAWSRLVPFEQASGSSMNMGAGSSSSSSSTSRATSSSSSSTSQPHQAKVSVAVAVDALIRLQGHVLVQLAAWMAQVAAAVAGGTAVDDGLRARLLHMQDKAAQQWALAVPQVQGRRTLYSPHLLLHSYTRDMVKGPHCASHQSHISLRLSPNQ